MSAFLSFLSFSLNMVAFVLLLLVTLSGLVVKGIYILILPWVDEFGHDLRMGVLGFCQTDYEVITAVTCYGPQRGYTIPFDVVTADGLPLNVAFMLDPVLVSVMILHPIAAGFAVLCAVLSLFNFNTSRPLRGLALTLAIWNGVFATVAFGVDVAVVKIAQSRVDQGIFLAYSGPGAWMTLAAAICIWVSVVPLVLKMRKYGGNHNLKSMEVTEKNTT